MIGNNRAFSYRALPTRVIFGRGTRMSVALEASRLGISRPMILCTPEQRETAERLAEDVGLDAAYLHAEAKMHTPVDVTENAREALRRKGCDGLLAVGGGSAIGLSKALAARTDLAQLIVPTTYAGSEMTDILGETEKGRKTTRRGPEIQPETVVYDPELTHSLPVGLSARSGMNAMAHAVEGLYAHDGGPVSAMFAREAISLLREALPALVSNPEDEEARDKALLGSHLAASVLGMVSMALHHKLCHVLGGTFDLPHAPVHSVMLPYSVGYNLRSASEELAPLAAMFGNDVPCGMFEFNQRLGVTETLADLGLGESDVDLFIENAKQAQYPNPAPLDDRKLRLLFEDALHGRPPRAY